MVQVYRHLVLFLLATGLCWSCETVARNPAGFPPVERPVAPIVSPVFAGEETRDRNGEADRVMSRLAIKSGSRVADIGAGQGYYTVRLARRLGPSGTVYAQDVRADYLKELEARVRQEGIRGVKFVLGMPNDPKLMPNSVDVALLSHMYHEIEEPYEFFYRLRPALAAGARVGIIDVDRPTQDHGTPPGVLRCELASVGYRQIDFLSLDPAEGYLAIFEPPPELPLVSSIQPCDTKTIGEIQ